MSIPQKKVFVTGATGFIGGWVVEAMHLSGLYTPIAAVRRWQKAVRIARFGVEMRMCDLMDRASLEAAMEGCDAVVHAAVGDDDVTIEGTRNVVEIARKLGIKRVVHLSTISVYGTNEGTFREDAPLDMSGTDYGARKIKAEQIALAASSDTMPVIALRPTIVYGPFGTQWTINFAHRIVSGTWGTFGDKAEGTCNLVYVGDVVRAIMCALETDKGFGQAFNVNGPDDLTWNEYFVRFARELGLPPLGEVSAGKTELKAKLFSPIRSFGKYVLTNHRDLLVAILKSSSLAEKAMRNLEDNLKRTPTSDQFALYGRKAFFPNNLATEVIGYAPKTSADEGLSLSVRWLKHHSVV
ncbi:oxidoreductase [Novosphingobium indicum]|uniref:Oxidoreductase n=1 Tax=Novosphingobium indicum TaxID=462949 RepID=A0ABQ2JUG3_9SPHN|nr:NAD-dependent epimerase/dehydratase family protein [Novosphingobium indicum]GGN57722.1 oxidoreductase [Novosphingobium indicum]